MNRNFTHNSNYTFITNLFGDETAYAVQSVNLPGLSFSHIDISQRGILGTIQGDTITFNDLSVNIIIDEKLEVWKDIVTSLLKMREPEYNTAEVIEKYGFLIIEDDQRREVIKLKFVNMKIESIDDLSYNSNSEDEIITCGVVLKYDYFLLE